MRVSLETTIYKGILIVSLMVIGVVLGLPSLVSRTSYKVLSKIDLLGNYIYNSSNNSWEDSHYIATALVDRGASDVRLLSSIAKVEADFDPNAVGDSGESLFMFQIQPKHHGPVPRNVFEQVSKARKVLYGFKTKNMNRLVWVSRYNGSGIESVRYSKKVDKVYKVLSVIDRREV